MAYVITDAWIKDARCVEVGSTDCIHPRKNEPAFDDAGQLFANPAECIDCSACVRKEFVERKTA